VPPVRTRGLDGRYESSSATPGRPGLS